MIPMYRLQFMVLFHARIDNLELEMKQILQEASLIGRHFLYKILNRITKYEDKLDSCLHGLEQIDLIKTKSLIPELEYLFKHALNPGGGL